MDLLPLLPLELLDINLRDVRPGVRGRDATIDGPVLSLDLRIIKYAHVPLMLLLAYVLRLAAGESFPVSELESYGLL